MSKLKALFSLFSLVALMTPIQTAVSETVVAQSLAEVAVDFAVNNISNLDFGAALAGDPAKVVPAGNGETPENASFEIRIASGYFGQGQLFLNTNWQMVEPNSGAVIQFSDFTYNFVNSNIGSTGNFETYLYCGATREAIPANAPPGVYVGALTIDLVL